MSFGREEHDTTVSMGSTELLIPPCASSRHIFGKSGRNSIPGDRTELIFGKHVKVCISQMTYADTRSDQHRELGHGRNSY